MDRVRFLDGLRGWGSVVVLLYHVFCEGFPASEFARDYAWRFVPLNGPFAVMVFFIVSGFALTVGYLRSQDLRQLRTIAASRYFRLALPVFFASAVVHLAQITGIMQAPLDRFPPWGTIVAFQPTTLHLLKFSFFDVFFNYDLSATYIGPLWTMPIELVGSFFAIGLVWVAVAANLKKTVMLAAMVVVICIGSAYFPFIFGAMLAELYNRRQLDRLHPLVGLICLVVSTVYLVTTPWTAGRMDMLVASIFVLGTICQLSVRAAFSSALSRHLGAISFPLYLMHGPVMLIFGAPMMQHFGGGSLSKWIVGLLVVAVSFLAAYAFMPLNNALISALRRASVILSPAASKLAAE